MVTPKQWRQGTPPNSYCDPPTISTCVLIDSKLIQFSWCVQRLHTMAEPLPEMILEAIASIGEVDTYSYACNSNIDHQAVVGAVKSLQSLGDVSLVYNN